MFVDNAKVIIKAGNGGDGVVSFHRTRGNSRGGPDGGDGGDGGDVVFVASKNQNTLSSFRFQKELKAEDGVNGYKKKQHGRNGKDLLISVPVGTQVRVGLKVLADLTEDGQTEIVAIGGRGGFGNAHFISSTRQTPRFAEKGEPGEDFEVELELKTIADIGLVGLPNAGKSTFLSRVSSAKPKIADYPFTTLNPHLGVARLNDKQELLIADIPGLIDGASEGKGLGDEFLRHVERTGVILHLVDCYSNNIIHDYKTIIKELKNYKIDLTSKPQILALTKIDGLDKDIIKDQKNQLESVSKSRVYTVSSTSGDGLKPLLYDLYKIVQLERTKNQSKEKNKLPIINAVANQNNWTVEYGEGMATLRGNKIERFASRTNFQNPEAVQRLRDIMGKLGILKTFEKDNLLPSSRVYFGDNETDYVEY